MLNTRWLSVFLCLQPFTAESRRHEKQNEIADFSNVSFAYAPPTYTGPSTGSGSAYASKCNAAKQTWVSKGGMTFVSTSVYSSTRVVNFPLTSYTTLTYLSPDPGPYTLCDGFPRINGSRTITSTLVPQTTTETLTLTTSISTSLPRPNCTIGASDCSTLHATWKKASAAYASFSYTDANATPPPYVPSPICGTATAIQISSAVGDAACAMQEASVQLLYWPVETVKPCDACHRSLSDCPTTTPAPTISGQPNTFVWRNNTLTSPTVYIAFEGSWAYTSDGTTHTEPQTLVIPQSSAAVSTYCGKPGGGYGPPQSVNYNNFNDPIPADVYRCQPSCFNNPLPYPTQNTTETFTYTISNKTTTQTATRISEVSHATKNLCSTIWKDYAPVLSIPHDFKTINPAGFVDAFGVPSVCQFIFNEDAVLFDPPIALTQVKTAAKPTLPNGNSAPHPTPTEAPPSPPPDHLTPNAPTLPTVYQPTVQPTAHPPAVAESQNLPAASQSPSNQPNSPPDSHPPPPPDRQPPPDQQPPPANQPPPGNQPPPSKTSPSVGDVIASVIGMTGKPASQVTVVYATDGAALLVNGAAASLIPNTASPGSVHSGSITVAGQTYSWSQLGDTVVINGQTLPPGGRISVNGQTMSLVGASQVVAISGDASSTLNLQATATSALTTGSGEGIITGVSNTLTYATSGGTLVISGHTLTPGETVTLGGETSSTAGTTRRTASSSAPSSLPTTTSGSSNLAISGGQILLVGLLATTTLFAWL